VREFTRRVREIFGDRLVGVYLGGSFSTGEFTAGSDYDLGVVLRDEPSDADIARLRQMHASLAREDPESLRLEGDYLVRDSLIPEGTSTPAWWFRWGALREREFMMSADNIANLGRQGITVVGPPASQIFPAVTRDQVRAAVRDMMAEEPDASSEIAAAREILDLARSLRALETGEPSSRAAGLEWGLEHMDPRWRPVLHRAAEVRGGIAVSDEDQTLRHALAELRGSLGLP